MLTWYYPLTSTSFSVFFRWNFSASDLCVSRLFTDILSFSKHNSCYFSEITDELFAHHVSLFCTCVTQPEPLYLSCDLVQVMALFSWQFLTQSIRRMVKAVRVFTTEQNSHRTRDQEQLFQIQKSLHSESPHHCQLAGSCNMLIRAAMDHMVRIRMT